MAGHSFFEALLNPHLSVPQDVLCKRDVDVEQRFNVYRNNVVSSLIDALWVRFPATGKLLGEEFFRAAASLYVRENPPKTRLMMFYGDDFASFLRSFAPAAQYPFVGDVAAFEALAVHAYHAKDESVLSVKCAQDLGETLVQKHIGLHASVRLFSSTYPVFSIWRAQVEPDAIFDEYWVEEFMCVCRPQMDVLYLKLTQAEYAFLMFLRDAPPLAFGVLIEMFMEQNPAQDFTPILQGVLLKEVLVERDLV